MVAAVVAATGVIAPPSLGRTDWGRTAENHRFLGSQPLPQRAEKLRYLGTLSATLVALLGLVAPLGLGVDDVRPD